MLCTVNTQKTMDHTSTPTETLRFSTIGITCAGCANKAGTILKHLPGVVAVRVDATTNTAEVDIVKGSIALDDLLTVLKPAGYGLIPQAA